MSFVASWSKFDPAVAAVIGEVSSAPEGKVDSGKASSSRKKGKSTSSGKAKRSAAASSAADLSARVRLPRDGTGSYDHKANTIPMMKGEIMRLRGVLGQTGRGTEHLDHIFGANGKGSSSVRDGQEENIYR